MKRYKRTFRGWVNVDTGELTDNRLLIDELDYLWDTLYYQNTVKCDAEVFNVSMTMVRGWMVSVFEDRIYYYPLLAFRAPRLVDSDTIEAMQQKALNAIVMALGVPSEYFRVSP